MTTAEQTEAAKKKLAEDKETRAKAEEQRAKMQQGKPTPTQEENDLQVLGAPVTEKADDGSGPDPVVEENKKRQEEARKRQEERRGEHHESRESKPASGSGGYQTRQSQPKRSE